MYGTPRQFIFMNVATDEIIVVGYFAAYKMAEKIKKLVFIGEV